MKKPTGSLDSFMDHQTAEPASAGGRQRKRLGDGRESMLIYIHPEGKVQLQLLKIETGKPVTALVAEAINAFLQANGKPPVA
jgi:hypothetical protein